MTGEWMEGERLAAPEAGTRKVCYQTRPFYPLGIRLKDGEGAVDGAPLLGGQVATGTQVETARRKSGMG